MYHRIRAGKWAAISEILVVVGLLGSVFVAPAGASPTNPANGATAVRARGAGQVGTKPSVTIFKFDARRDVHGRLEGAVVVHCAGKPRQNFVSKTITSLTVTGNVATFTATGKLTGTANNHKTFTADITATDADPDSISIVVHNGDTPSSCVTNGALTSGLIVVPA